MKNINAWVLTDDNSCQYVKKINEDEFQLIEMSLVNPDTKEYIVYTDEIDVDAYLEQNRGEVGEILYSFGYGWPKEGEVEFDSVEDSINEVINKYSNASQIIAECIFEYYSSFQAHTIFKGSGEQCRRFIENYTFTN